MKKRSITLVLSAAVASSVLFSSCIGSFGLTHKVLDWNRNIDNKFVNELVFIALWIVPVYEIAAIADVLVINSIEFWSGSNPATADLGKVQTIDTKHGAYTVETKKDGYHIQKAGAEQAVDLVYHEADKSWNIETNGQVTKLMRFDDNNNVTMYLPDGKEMTIEPSQAGVLAFRQAVESRAFYAAR